MSDTESPVSSLRAKALWRRIAPYIPIGICIIVVCAPCVWFIRTNVLNPTITRDFETVELLLDVNSLPPAWRVEDTYTYLGLSDVSWSEDQAGRFYSRYDEDGARITRATITIWHYDYPDPRDYERMFGDCRGWAPPPPYLTFTSQHADQQEICCVVANPAIYACAYSAAYNEFLVEVWVKMARGDSPEDLFISPEEINALFAAQDQRMAEFLDLEPQE